MSARARATRVVGSTLLNIAALGGLVCIVLVILALVFHITLIMFKTGSMTPTIPAGSIAFVQQIPASEIRIGDIVTVDRPGELPVTHRVTSVTGEGDTRTITMKGDANTVEDPRPYTVSDVRRVLFAAPGLANVVVWFSNPLVLGIITVLASLLVTWAFWPRDERDERAARAAKVGGAVLAAVAMGSVIATAPAVPAAAAPEVQVASGKHLRLTSIGDADQMRNMLPGVPVLWQVGVEVDAPEPGLVTLSLQAEGSQGLGLTTEIRSCDVRWVGTTCDGVEALVRPREEVALGEARTLTTMRDTEQRWLLVSAMVPEGGAGEVALALRAEGRSDSVIIGPGSSAMLANTGSTPHSAVSWLAVAALVAGLGAAGVARLVKQRSSVHANRSTGAQT